MTKTLKQLQEEYPHGWCEDCGYIFPYAISTHLCHKSTFKALTAAKREDEKEIEGLSRKLDETFCEAHRQGSYLRDQLTAAQATIAELERDLLVQAGRSDGKNIIIRELGAKLSAEREAHAATKEELRKAEETTQQLERELEEVDEAIIKAADSEDAELVMERIYQAALARRASRQASINRPTDKQPTDDREPNKEGDWE